MKTLAIAFAVVACAACADPGPASLGDDPSDPQLPARGSDDMPAWLAGGFYTAWHCEPSPHPGRSPSPHGTNRICSNDALVASSGEGAYPVGAAAVKEIYDGASIRQFAVYRKVGEGDGGDTWYWFEGNADRTVANGTGDGTCVGCHAHAPRDFVFTVVP